MRLRGKRRGYNDEERRDTYTTGILPYNKEGAERGEIVFLTGDRKGLDSRHAVVYGRRSCSSLI